MLASQVSTAHPARAAVAVRLDRSAGGEMIAQSPAKVLRNDPFHCMD
jgi:hypothetical protein